jgi:hypothetical protein
VNIKHDELPLYSRTLSVIYLTQRDTYFACRYHRDTDQLIPEEARQPVTQERHAAARSYSLSITLASTHITLTSLDPTADAAVRRTFPAILPLHLRGKSSIDVPPATRT